MPNFSFSYHVMLLVYWAAWSAVHSFLASASLKNWLAEKMGRSYAYYRLGYSLFAAITLALILVFQFSHESPMLYRPNLPLGVLAVFVGSVGLAGMASCIAKYFVNLSGVDVLLKTKRPAVLETGGLHHYVRHPLYSSTLLVCWSLFIVLPQLDNLLACLVITLYTLFGIRLEEKKLHEEFGNQYRRYAGDTPMLIPGLGRLFRRGEG